MTDSSNASDQTIRTPSDYQQSLRLRLDPNSKPVMMPKTTYCRVCSNLDLNHKGPGTMSLRNSLKALHEASESGCVYCTIIYKTRSVFAPEISNRFNQICLHTDHMNSHSTRFCWRWTQDPEFGPFGIHNARDIILQLSLCEKGKPWGRFSKWEGIPASARSSETIHFYEHKLQECLASHLECWAGSGWLPTRLLSLRDGLGSLKLIEPFKADSLQYAALSHPWGASIHLVLKTGNEASMKHLVPWDSLPQTYRDAVWVCRILGIDYVWIDSLCIKQDDNQDWDREAAKMADVYENAHIVIAASCCRNTEDSFLDYRRPANCGPVVAAWNDDQKPKPLLQAQKIPRTGIHLPPGIESLDPLDSRAWAFQEKRLARRLLNFTSGEVQWSCKTTFSCECPKAWDNRASFWNTPSESTPQIVPATTEEWKYAISKFSALDLTYLSDKLPALSGLWYNDQIVEQLAWFQLANQTSGGNEQYLAYRAPTFSWASTNAKVMWYSKIEGLSAYIKILAAHCTIKNENPFGEVNDGYISLQGRIVRLILQQPPTNDLQPYLCFMDGANLGLPFYIDDKGIRQNYIRKIAMPAQGGTRLGRSIQWVSEAKGDLPESLPVLCLRICVYGVSMTEHFLILVESSYELGTYERMGLVVVVGNLVMGEQKEKLEKLLTYWESAPTEELKIV